MPDILKVYKVPTLPQVLEPDSMYLTLTEDAQAFNIHVTDLAGTRAVPLNASAGGEEGVDQFMLMGVGINA